MPYLFSTSNDQTLIHKTSVALCLNYKRLPDLKISQTFILICKGATLNLKVSKVALKHILMDPFTMSLFMTPQGATIVHQMNLLK